VDNRVKCHIVAMITSEPVASELFFQYEENDDDDEDDEYDDEEDKDVFELVELF
jgi:hypothetical protein